MSAANLAADLFLVLAALGLALPVAYAGQAVLGHSAFVAVGAYGVVLLGGPLPLPAAVAAAAALAGATGWLVGFAAARLSGAPLALATWALAWLASAVLLAFPGTYGGAAGRTVAVPARLESPSLGLAVRLTPGVLAGVAAFGCAVTLAALVRLAAGPLGTDLAALREGPALAASLGVDVAARRRAVLAAGAALGAVAGAGRVLVDGVVTAADVSPLLSLELFVAVLVGLRRPPWGVVAGAVLVALLPDAADAAARAVGGSPERSRGVLVAVLLILAVGARRTAWHGRGGSGPADADGATRRARPQPAIVDSPLRTVDGADLVLVARGVRASYGRRVVVDGIDLELRPGTVHALVGPNGSGKSTLLRVLAGAHPADAGEIRLRGDRLDPAAGPARRARAGVVRTFQRTAVLGGVPALRQALVGVRPRGRVPALRHLVATPAARADAAARERTARSALARCGVAVHAVVRPAGEERLLQVARAVATGAPVLLLDEPAAGMSGAERARLASVLRGLARNGTAVLLVEHDMRLVGALADHVTVLAEGQVLAEGAADEVRADPQVRRAYLGAGA